MKDKIIKIGAISGFAVMCGISIFMFKFCDVVLGREVSAVPEYFAKPPAPFLYETQIISVFVFLFSIVCAVFVWFSPKFDCKAVRIAGFVGSVTLFVWALCFVVFEILGYYHDVNSSNLGWGVAPTYKSDYIALIIYPALIAVSSLAGAVYMAVWFLRHKTPKNKKRKWGRGRLLDAVGTESGH